MAKYKGIINKITGNKCIIITQDGSFERIPLPKGTVRVGQEIEVSSFNWSYLLRYSLIAASLLFAFFGFSLTHQTATATPVAYVTLDINPSMELAVDQKHRVINISSLNNDAQHLITNLNYQNQDVYQVVSMIVQQAINLKYVAADRPNLVVSTVVELQPQNNLDTNDLQAAVAKPLEGKTLKTGIIVMKAKTEDRAAANKIKLTTGKYLFYKSKQQSGDQISLNEFKKQSIASLVKAKKIKLPKTQSGITIKYLNTQNEQLEDIFEQNHNNQVKPNNQNRKGKLDQKLKIKIQKQKDRTNRNTTVTPQQYLQKKDDHEVEKRETESRNDDNHLESDDQEDKPGKHYPINLEKYMKRKNIMIKE